MRGNLLIRKSLLEPGSAANFCGHAVSLDFCPVRSLFMSRRNREGDKFSYDGWYSEGAGKEFVTTGDVEAIWKSFVKKHHKRKLVPTIEYDVVGGELQAGPG